MKNFYEITDEGYAAYIAESLEDAKKSCPDPVVLVEQRVDILRYVPECYGTADCVLIADGQMTIADFKYGLGVLVSAKENPQLMCYASGALEMLDALYEMDSVRKWSLRRVLCVRGRATMRRPPYGSGTCRSRPRTAAIWRCCSFRAPSRA